MAKPEEMAVSSSRSRVAACVLEPDTTPPDGRPTVVAADVGGARLLVLGHGWQAGFSEEAADELMREGEGWAEGPDDLGTLASVCAAYGIAVVRTLGQLSRARLFTEAGLRFAHKARDPVLTFAVEVRHAFVCEYGGDVIEITRAAEIANRHDAQEMDAGSALLGQDGRAMALGLRGVAACHGGRLREATVYLGTAIEMARERGAMDVVGWLLSYVTRVRLCRGDVAAGLESAREAMAIAERGGYPMAVGLASILLGSALGRSGDLRGAVAAAERAVEATAQTLRPTLPEALGDLAVIQCELGGRSAARKTAERALKIAEECGFRQGRVHAEMALAGIALAGRDEASLEEATRRLARAKEAADALAYRLVLPDACELRAALAARRGDDAGAAAALREAEAIRCELDAPYDQPTP
jgi:tetratricopeptide (TPR) repeat protein